MAQAADFLHPREQEKIWHADGAGRLKGRKRGDMNVATHIRKHQFAARGMKRQRIHRFGMPELGDFAAGIGLPATHPAVASAGAGPDTQTSSRSATRRGSGCRNPGGAFMNKKADGLEKGSGGWGSF